MTDIEALALKIKGMSGIDVKPNRINVFTDISDWMGIKRGDILRLGGHDYVVRGNMHEPRFGIDEQPKYWVFSAIDLDSGLEKIIKAVFHEEFYAHIGLLKIRCYRSPQKEADVLELVKGDKRFMQGYSILDDKANNIRIIDYIKGTSYFKFIPELKKTHIDYYYTELPAILRKLYDSFLAIKFLHDNKQCHGDIRNDHIIIESATNEFKWIDFDLKQDVSDFDIWSFGNLLNYTIAKGIKTFDHVLKSDEFSDEVKNSLVSSDGSAFFNYRIINLKKLYKYISDDLNNLLMHFAMKPAGYFKNIDEFCLHFERVINKDFS